MPHSHRTSTHVHVDVRRRTAVRRRTSKLKTLTYVDVRYVNEPSSYELQIWPVKLHLKGPSEQKLIRNSGDKGAWAYPGTAQICGYRLLSQERVKLRTSNFLCTWRNKDYMNDRNKSPLSISGKVAVGVARDSRNFSGRPHIQGVPKKRYPCFIFAITSVNGHRF